MDAVASYTAVAYSACSSRTWATSAAVALTPRPHLGRQHGAARRLQRISARLHPNPAPAALTESFSQVRCVSVSERVWAARPPPAHSGRFHNAAPESKLGRGRDDCKTPASLVAAAGSHRRS